MTAYNYNSSARDPNHIVAQGVSLALQSSLDGLSELPRALSIVRDQVEFLTIEMTEIIPPEARALPAPFDSQEGRGYRWEYGATPSLRATVLSTVATFLSLCLYLAIRAYVSTPGHDSGTIAPQ